MLTLSMTVPCLQLCKIVANKCNIEMDVETTQIAAACLGISTVILCRRQKNVTGQRKIWVKPCSPPNMY